MKLRLISLLFAVLILSSSILVSCKKGNNSVNNTKQTDDGTKTADAEDTRLDLPEEKFDGADFRVLAGNRVKWPMWNTIDLTVDEDSDSQISSAVFKRNDRVEKRLGVKIKSDIITDMDPWDKAVDLYNTNFDNYEAYLMIINHTSGLVANGILKDMYDLPYLDTTNPWWDSTTAADSEIFGSLYFAMGDINITDDNATWACFINNDLAKDLGITTDYNTVLDGDWNIDRMIGDSRSVTTKINGSETDPLDQNDRWGTVHQNEAIAAYFASFGGYTVQNEEGTPTFVADTEKMISYLSMAQDFFFMDKCQTTAEDYRTVDANNYFAIARDIFTSGRGLYYIAPILTVVDTSGLRGMKNDYGIFPMPKYDDSQKDYINSFQYSNATVYSVPIQNSRDELTGAVLEAMAYYSTDTLKSAYYDVVLDEKGTRDDTSKLMLDRIFGTRINDLGFVYDWGGMITIYYYMGQNQINPVTMFGLKASGIKGMMDQTLEEILKKNTGAEK